MRKRVILIPIVLVVLLAVWSSTRYGRGLRAAKENRRWHENLAEAERNAEELRQRIETEVAALTNHDWAGDYYCGDGEGENISLYLAPQAGYLYENRGCEFVWDRSMGRVVGTSDRIRLLPEVMQKDPSDRRMADEYFVVPWGDRRYLVPTNGLIEFCNAVNSGIEPRRYPWGDYLLLSWSWTNAVSGKPLVPDDFRKYMLMEPVTGAIIAVTGVTRSLSGLGWYSRKVTATVNIGTDSGLAAGMKLQVVVPDDVLWENVLVTGVEKRTAQILMSQFKEEDAFPTNDWQLSTRTPWEDMRR